MTIMESYLMMLYVTLEQESALKNFFVMQGWNFCKPDMTVTTDKLGPSVQITKSETYLSTTSTSSALTSKRKLKVKQKAPVIKMAKIVSSKSDVSSTHASAKVKSEVNKLNEFEDVSLQDEDIGSDCKLPISDAGLEVKTEDFKVSFNSDIEDDVEEEGAENIEETDTDADYNFEEKVEKIEAGDNEMAVECDGSRRETHMEAEKESGQNHSKNLQGAKYGTRHQHSYTKSQIDSALHYYLKKGSQGKKVSMRSLAEMFSVPMTTLFNHIRSASGKLQKSVVCEICGHGFTYQHQLKQHVTQQHEDFKTTYKCHQCNKPFLSKSRLQHHLNMHTGERPYVCKNMCGKSYFSPQSRYSHELVCQNNHRLQCTKCGLSFKVRSALNRHITAKHEAPKFSCQCGQTFGWSNSFQRHMKSCKKVQVAMSDEQELQRVVETLPEKATVIYM